MCSIDPQQLFFLIGIIALMLVIAVFTILGMTAEMFIERDPPQVEEDEDEPEDDEPEAPAPVIAPIVAETPPAPVTVTTTSAL